MIENFSKEQEEHWVNQAIVGKNLAPISRRLIAYGIDFALFNGLVLILLFLVIRLLLFGGTFLLSMIISLILIPILLMVFLIWILNLPQCIILWRSNGFTPGKRIMKIRVAKLDGKPLSFGEAFYREALLKGIGNLLTAGLLNILSLVWTCISEERKTVHDLAVATKVVEWEIEQ